MPFMSLILFMPLSMAAVELPEGVHEAAYFDGLSIDYVSVSQGNGRNNDMAMKFMDTNLRNMKIVGAKVSHLRPSGLTNIKIWESKGHLKNPDGQVVDCTIDMADSSVTALFPEPIDLTFGGRYIGCYFENTLYGSEYYKCPCSTPLNLPYSNYVMENRSEWYDIPDWGCATITVYLTGDLKPNALRPIKALNTAVALAGEPVMQQLQVVNYGGNEISSIGYSYEADGKTHHQTLSLDTPLCKTLTLKQTLTLPLYGIYTPGQQSVKIEIDSINGQPNAHSMRKITVPVSINPFLTTHRPIVEEGTGTECGWCTRGMLGLDKMHELYPDFISAAYHRYNSTDPMYCPDELPMAIEGFPGAMIDRNGSSIDPFFGSSANTDLGIQADYLQAQALPAPADLAVEALWLEDSVQLVATANVRFAFTKPGQSYTLGYIVTHDSLSHPDLPAWEQKNFITGQQTSPQLQTIADGTFDITTFNHVVVWTGTYMGVPGSLPDSIQVNHPYIHQLVIPLADNTLIENPTQLHVIGLLLDSNGHIANAASATPTLLSHIPVLGADNLEGESPVYYDLLGRQIPKPIGGITIERRGTKARKLIRP